MMAMSLAASACFDTTNGFYDPDGNIKAPDHGVYVVRRDNPALTGRALLGVTEELSGLPTYSTTRVIEPDAIRAGCDTPGVLTDDGWVWSDAPVDVSGAMFADTLRLPGIQLPMGGIPVTLTLDYRRHRVRTEPVPPGTNPPSIGFDEGRLDTMQVALDPHVLLLPVRVHRFVRPSTPIFAADRRYFEQTLDVAEVETIDAFGESNPFESAMHVVSGRLPPPAVDVDGIFTQCDIQFRLELYEEIPQTDNLENVLTDDCRCQNNGVWMPGSSPLATYLSALPSPEIALDIFVGGAILQGSSGCGVNTRGVTCGPSNSQGGGSCATPSSGASPFHPHNFVLLHADAVRTDPLVLAHELGHLIGLTHSPNGGNSQCLASDDTDGVEDLLMSSSAAGAVLTPNQCGRARCIAAYWLHRLGRFSIAQRDAVCAE